MKHIAVIDAETDPFNFGYIPAPFAWGLYDGDTFYRFWGEDCTEQLIRFLADKNYLLYAHNGGKFDFFFLLEYLEKGKITITGGRIIKANIMGNELRDSYSIFPMPLSAYKKDDIDYDKFTSENREKNKAEIIDYLEGDCVYLYELVTAFRNRFGNKLTIASTAMGELKERLNSEDKFKNFSLGMDEKYRKYYYGGRCQAIKKGRLIGDYKIFDINSAYPFAMTHQHPSPYITDFEALTGALPEKEVYFATVEAVSKGALPFRHEDGSLTFPNDEIPRIYSVTGWEIRAGLDTGTLKILNVIDCRVPVHTIDFKDFVLPIYDDKKKAKISKDIVAELLAKLLLNSSYGKFALNPLKYKDWILVTCGEHPELNDEQQVYKDLIDAGYDREKLTRPAIYELQQSLPQYDLDVYSIDTPKEDGFYNVTVAASITGFVRAFLWRAICSAVEPIYCDTDSIICKELNVPMNNDLGAWKLEGEATGVWIAGKKMYAAELLDGTHKTACKGARLTPEEIKVISEDKDAVIEWRNDAPTFSVKRGTSFIEREIRQTG